MARPCRSISRPSSRPGSGPWRSAATAPPTSRPRRRVIELPGGGRIALLTPYSPARAATACASGSAISSARRLHSYLARYGRPIRYGYVRGSYPISAYQNVYATEPGSAEMPSAGRPFTPEVMTRLVAKGVGVAPLLLHTGVASLEANEPPYAEYFKVSLATAHRINDTRRSGGRVIAIGTTVVRALESVVDEHGRVHPGEGWTETVVSPERPVRSIDGFLTGWHEPEASHLAMLEAIAGRRCSRCPTRPPSRRGTCGTSSATCT